MVYNFTMDGAMLYGNHSSGYLDGQHSVCAHQVTQILQCLITEGRACSFYYKNSNVFVEVREFNSRPILDTFLDSILGAATIIVSALIAGKISNAEVRVCGGVFRYIIDIDYFLLPMLLHGLK